MFGQTLKCQDHRFSASLVTLITFSANLKWDEVRPQAEGYRVQVRPGY